MFPYYSDLREKRVKTFHSFYVFFFPERNLTVHPTPHGCNGLGRTYTEGMWFTWVTMTTIGQGCTCLDAIHVIFFKKFLYLEADQWCY